MFHPTGFIAGLVLYYRDQVEQDLRIALLAVRSQVERYEEARLPPEEIEAATAPVLNRILQTAQDVDHDVIHILDLCDEESPFREIV